MVMVIGDIGEGVRVWPGNGEEEKHPLVVNGNWEYGGLIVTGIKEYPGVYYHQRYRVKMETQI